MSLPIKCPECGHDSQLLSPREIDEAAGYGIDHRLNGSVEFWTRAEVLAFGERVRRECRRAVVAIGPAPLAATYDNAIDEAVDAVDAVDVARLLDSDVDPESAWTKGNIP